MDEHAPREPVPAEQVREQLGRLLANDRFTRSQALSRFLRYTMEEFLQGRGETLKEFLVGLEVFERGKNFDPRIDPIVRVQAAKLRTRLKEYYETEGAADPVVIEYPKGGYTPMARLRASVRAESPPVREAGTTEPPPAAPDRFRVSRTVWLGLGGAIAMALLVTAVRLWPGHRIGSAQPPLSLIRLTADAGSTTFPAISRDGKWIAFASDRSGRGDLDIWVQPVQGGDAVRLSHHEAADTTPDLSPEGTQIVFRSGRDGGGLYLVSVLGGPERRIADAGWRPRFSPDGTHIAYQGTSPRRGGDLYVVAAGGGEPRRVNIGTDIELGGTPIWTPNGRHLLFLGSDLRRNRAWDWWIVPQEGGAPASTGFADLLAQQSLPAPDIHTVPGDWVDDSTVFSISAGPVANLWLIPFAPGSKRFSGPARQITFGTAHETFPRVSRDHLLVLASESQNSHLFEIPRHSKRAAAEPARLTNDLALDVGFFRALTRFSSSDRHLIFPSSRRGNFDVFVKDLATGAESAITANPEPEDQPLLAPDRTRVAYRSREAGASPIYLAQIGTQVSRKICDDCGEPNSFTADGRRLLFTKRGGLGLLDIDTGRKTELFRNPSVTVRHAALSPDQQRLALTVDDSTRDGERAFLVPFGDHRVPREDQWSEVLKGFAVESLHWAPDGSSLYFFSTRDDFRCLWQQPVGPGSRLPGSPSVVAHFHDNRRCPWSSWLAVTPDRIIVSLTEPNSNLWTARLAVTR